LSESQAGQTEGHRFAASPAHQHIATLAASSAMGAAAFFAIIFLLAVIGRTGFLNPWTLVRAGLVVGMLPGLYLVARGQRYKHSALTAWITVLFGTAAFLMAVVYYGESFPGAGLAEPIWSFFVLTALPPLIVSALTRDLLVSWSLLLLIPLNLLLVVFMGRSFGDVTPDWQPPFPLGIALLPIANGVAFGLAWLNARIEPFAARLLLPSLPVIWTALDGPHRFWE
jgi:hypothetical protein